MNELQQITARAIVNIFETGRVTGRYGAVGVLKGDAGHLSYGRSQAALGSGVLYSLLELYCQQSTAPCAVKILTYLPRVKNRDVTLDTDSEFKGLLKLAATDDPIMPLTQDQFFDGRYLAPACNDAAALGITDPLGITVIYDSHIQGGWALLKQRNGPMTTRGARDWIQRYIACRKTWLESLKAPLPTTAYRMEALGSLATQAKWNLELPLTVHNVTITTDALVAGTPTPGHPRRLSLTTPYLRGPDVVDLQRALQQRGLPLTPDGTYGAFTSTVVEQWQAQQHIAETGVGSLTRQSLGLAV